MDISVIVVSYNTAGLLEQCVANLRSAIQDSLKVEIIFVDNASKDNSVEVIKTKFPECRLIVNEVNVGFGRANNQALQFATGRYILLLNTDAFVSSDTLSKTVAYMDANPRSGILGVRLEGRDGVLQPCCRYFPTPWNTFLWRTGLNRSFAGARMVDDLAWPHDTVRACDWVVGCYYLLRREVVDDVGLFDPKFFLYFEEVDHCFAARKHGWDVVFFPHTTVIHLGGESAKSVGAVTKSGQQLERLQVESELLYFRKNFGLLSVVGSVMLSVLADLLNMCKRAFKPGLPVDVSGTLRHILLVASTFMRTRFATKATR
jgi:N-acetylglucosaminyl-diphospho-decaprenol L-rhamnosyltransferase